MNQAVKAEMQRVVVITDDLKSQGLKIADD